MFQKLEGKIHALLEKHSERAGLDLPYFVKNGFWVVLRQAISTLCGLVLSVAFARLATQEVFGQYQFILSILSIVSILSIPGLNTSVVRSAAGGYDGDYKNAVRKSFLWSLLGIPAILVIGGYYYAYQNQALGMAFMVSSIFFPFFYAPNTWDYFLQGKSRFDVSARFSSVQAVINASATTAVVFFYRDNLAVITMTYMISYSFFNGYYYWKSLAYVDNDRQDEEAVRYGWFLTKMNALGIIAENADRIILGAFLSPAALSAYAIVSIIPTKIKDLGKPLLNVFFPKLVGLRENVENIIREKKKLIFLLVLFLVIMSAVYYIFIEKINYLLFGGNYAQYYFYSKYFTAFFALYMPLNIMMRYAQAKKKNRIILVSDTGYYLMKIVLSIFFIIKYGIFGAVIAFNVSFLLWFSFYAFNLFWSEKINPDGS